MDIEREKYTVRTDAASWVWIQLKNEGEGWAGLDAVEARVLASDLHRAAESVEEGS